MSAAKNRLQLCFDILFTFPIKISILNKNNDDFFNSIRSTYPRELNINSRRI